MTTETAATQEPTIMDIVREARSYAISVLSDDLEISVSAALDYPHTICALQALPKPYVDELAIPFIRQALEDYKENVHPTLIGFDRLDLVVAEGIRAVTQYVQMQQQQQMRQAAQSQRNLANGTLGAKSGGLIL